MLVYHRYILLLFLVSIVLSLAYLSVTYFDITVTTYGEDLPLNRQLLLNRLSTLKTELEVAHQRNQPPSTEVLTLVENLLASLNPTEFSNDKTRKNHTSKTCVETYTNTSYGYPFYEKGWIQNCSKNINVDGLVTVLLNPSLLDGNCVEFAERVITGIHNSNPKTKIIIGSQDVMCEKNYAELNIKNINIVHYNPTISDGEIWNDLISKVETEFVVIGRDLEHWSWFSRLHRQISAFEITKNVVVVGGSSRNSTGHWKIGCYQSEMRNYALKYLDGYYSSKNECMFCDHLQNSFMSKTKYLQKMKLDPSINKENLFEEFFLRVKSSGGIVLNCPDVMYFSTNSDDVKRESDRLSWLKVAKKYKLNYVFYPPNTKFKYSCKEIGFNCAKNNVLTRFYLMPPCCEEMYINAWKFIQNLSESNNLKFEIDCGSLMGAVKVRGIIPWDIDGDSAYLSVQHFNWTKYEKLFKENGFGFHEIQSAKLNNRGYSLSGGYFTIDTPDNIIEMYGSSAMSTEILPIELRNIPTKVELRGFWVYSVANPGLYARNRYGIEYLKHAHSWRHTGGRDSYIPYTPGRFNICPDHNFHACADKFSPDGNLQFLVF